MQNSKTHWPSILTLIVLGLGVFIFLASAFVSGTISLLGLFDGSTDPVGNMIKCVSSGFELMVVLVSSWFILQKSAQQEKADQVVNFSLSNWQMILILGVVFLALIIGAVVSISDIQWLGWLILPILTLLVVILPILLFLGIGTNGINLGPRWRTWGTLGLGMTLSPFVMIALEAGVGIFFLIAASIVLASQPELMGKLMDLVNQLNQGISEEAALELIVPYITKPGSLVSIFLFLSLIVPMIEELFKPLAVWLFVKNINSASTGFALGMLSGGAFGLVESLNVSGNGGESWFVIVGIRAGTSLLHMGTAGLMGYAIVQLIKEKRIWRFIVTYLTVVALHGIWNACAAGTALSSFGAYVGKPEWIWNLPAILCGIVVLATGMLAILITVNKKIRLSDASLSIPENTGFEEGVK